MALGRAGSQAISIRGVDLVYTGQGEPVPALSQVDLEVAESEFVSLIGPSGCGKSTLLRLVADLLPPTRGAVLIGGRPASETRRERRIGLVFQEPALMPWRRVMANVTLPLEIVGQRSGQREVAKRLLRLVGLEGFERLYPAQLSGGMRQRVAIARALTADPVVLLMDEPFGALDEITRDRMNTELLKIWQETGKTILFVTHSLAEAVYLSDRVAVLTPRPGRIRTVINITLPRPRQPEIKQSEEFFALENQVLRALGGTG
ncbi:MAG: ABC transporter ATP-binding protein [Deinococcus sp.]|nr:ABC transporter ATP-binding protein [Deinococcus sp.]